MNPRYMHSVLAGIATLLIVSTTHAANIGTAFTFQGNLESPPGTPVTGVNCDFQFGLWGSLAGVDQIGLTQTVSAVPVNKGVFLVGPPDIDFGGGAFNGTARWLEIAVRCPTGVGSYDLLSPRVELTPVPYALALPGLYTQQNATSPNLIGGLHENSVTANVVGATIAGGGVTGSDINRVTDNFGTVGGGCTNRAGDDAGTVADHAWATVGGGLSNTANGGFSTIGGGQQNTTQGSWESIGGGTLNETSGSTATVGGGQANNAFGTNSTIGGGAFNQAGAAAATVGGGDTNTASGPFSTVSGGFTNTASGIYSTVGGGVANTASGESATVGGGFDNQAIGDHSTVPGGQSCVAGGDYSFAAGRLAKVRTAGQVGGGDLDGDEGTFVWADSPFADFISTGPNQFLIRASGGVGIGTNAPAHPLHMASGAHVTSGGVWTDSSDRNVKENFGPLHGHDVLDQLAHVPITRWNFKAQDASVQHIGPTAQDFHAAFGTGEDDKHLAALDTAGVALAAIQGLYEIVQQKDCEIDELIERDRSKDHRLGELEERNAELEARMARMEALLSITLTKGEKP